MFINLDPPLNGIVLIDPEVQHMNESMWSTNMSDPICPSRTWPFQVSLQVESLIFVPETWNQIVDFGGFWDTDIKRILFCLKSYGFNEALQCRGTCFVKYIYPHNKIIVWNGGKFPNYNLKLLSVKCFLFATTLHQRLNIHWTQC